MTQTLSKGPGASSLPGLIVLGLAYFLLAKLGLAVASLHPSASPVWPPSGLALAACLLFGHRVWPAIAAGAFLANVLTFGSIATSLAIAAGNTLEALVTAWLVARWCTRGEPFGTPSRVVVFAGLTFAPGTMISATIGVGSLLLAGYITSEKFPDIWLTWWLGDVGGQLLVAPMLILWAESNPIELGREDWQRIANLMAVTIIVGVLAFSPLMQQTAQRGAFAFLAIVPLMWAALRYSQRDTATVAFVLSFFAIWGTFADGGPFARPSLNDSFLLVLMFVISTAVPSLVLSADVAVRKSAQARLQLLVRELQHRTKNQLAVVQSIVRNTIARSRSLDVAVETIERRMEALARAQDYVVSGAANGMRMSDLVKAELTPFGPRIRVDGVPLAVGGAFCQKLALVLHELATNATKYGSLSRSEGRVLVAWQVERGQDGDDVLKFSWKEQDGPAVAPPGERGFGMQLIAALLDDASSASFGATGLEFSFELPLAKVLEDGK